MEQGTNGVADEIEAQTSLAIKVCPSRGCDWYELDNWSFLEYWVSAKAIAWRPLPEPFAGGVLGYNRKEAAK